MIPSSPLHCKHPWRFGPFKPAQQHASGRSARQRHGLLSKAFLGRSEGPWRQKPEPLTWQKIGAWLVTAGFATALSFTCVTQSVLAVTNEQLLFLEAWRAVDRAYVDKNFNGKPWFRIREQYIKDKPLSTRQETYAAIRDLLAELDDPFTRFLEPSRYAALKRGTAGSVTGVGLEVGFDTSAGSDSKLMVITPSADGPADKAGIKPRDGVIAIDGKLTAGGSLYDAGDRLQGPEGSQVTLTIKPADGSESREVQLMRQRIINNPVSSQLCQKVPLGEITDEPERIGKVGYIRVATFSKQTTDNVKTALHKLQAKEANMIILDIRNNGGGLFPAGVEVARELLNDGDIVLIADSQGVRDSYPASNIAIEPKKPLSVLVNRGTASASEVLAGALQDNGRAKIVGERTFGKGLIQTIVELSDGSGVAVTVARYQTPLGTDINKKGIQPDILIQNGDMPPTNGAGFCKYIADRGAAVLFDANAAARMPPGDAQKRADGAGESLPIDVTQYENAFISGPSSDASAAPEKKEAEKSASKQVEPSKAEASNQPDDVKTAEGQDVPGSDQTAASRSEAENIPESPASAPSSSPQPDAVIESSSDNQASPGDTPDAPLSGKSPEEKEKEPSASTAEPSSDSEELGKQEEPREPPIQDTPAPVHEVTTPNKDAVTSSPVAKDSPSGSEEKVSPISLEANPLEGNLDS